MRRMTGIIWELSSPRLETTFGKRIPWRFLRIPTPFSSASSPYSMKTSNLPVFRWMTFTFITVRTVPRQPTWRCRVSMQTLLSFNGLQQAEQRMRRAIVKFLIQPGSTLTVGEERQSSSPSPRSQITKCKCRQLVTWNNGYLASLPHLCWRSTCLTPPISQTRPTVDGSSTTVIASTIG